MLDQPGLGVGQVFELEVVGQVAERPDPGHVRCVGVVGAHMPVRVDLDAGRGDVEAVAVRRPPGRHEQHLALSPLWAGGRGEVQADPSSGCRHSLCGCAKSRVEALSAGLREAGPDVEVVVGKQVPAAGHDRHLRAEGPEDVAHLGHDITAAQDHHRIRQRIETHHCVRRR